MCYDVLKLIIRGTVWPSVIRRLHEEGPCEDAWTPAIHVIVILLGPPGVGKGTQAVLLAEDFGWRHLSTGDLLRGHRREGTPRGVEAQGFMDRGELVPDDVILAMVREEMVVTTA